MSQKEITIICMLFVLKVGKKNTHIVAYKKQLYHRASTSFPLQIQSISKRGDGKHIGPLHIYFYSTNTETPTLYHLD